MNAPNRALVRPRVITVGPRSRIPKGSGPHSFFTSRHGFHVQSSFEDVLKHVRDLDSIGLATLAVHEPGKRMLYDEFKLAVGPIRDIELWHIEWLLREQYAGETKPLTQLPESSNYFPFMKGLIELTFYEFHEEWEIGFLNEELVRAKLRFHESVGRFFNPVTP